MHAGVYSVISKIVSFDMPILHSVFFYFKPDTSADAIEMQRVAIVDDLSKIEAVNQIWAGGPEGIERDVVDNAYGMSLHMLVDNREALQIYQSDPIHQEFLERFKSHWSGIKVYDTRI